MLIALIIEASADADDMLLNVHLVDEQERALGPEQIYALVQLDAMHVALDFHMLQRKVMTSAIPRNAAERHVVETGHLLRFGCCRGHSQLSTQNDAA